MDRFLSFVKKELLHILRDKRTMLLLLGMPIAQIVLFGFAISTEVGNTRVAILDLSRDEATRRIASDLDANRYFEVAKRLENASQIEPVFLRGEASLVVVFQEGFRESLLRDGTAKIQLIADATDPNTATVFLQYGAGVATAYARELSTTPVATFRIVPEVRLLYNPQMEGAYNFVPGVLGMMMLLVCAMMTSISIVRERETGTMEVLLVSPVRPIFVIAAKMVPYFLLSCVNLATVLAISVFVLHVPLAGSLPALVLVSFVYILLALALGLLISTIAATQVAAMLVSGMAFMLPVILLSGMMFPIESMPVALRWISHAIPARWYIAAVKDLMIKGLGFQAIAMELAILSGMTVSILAVALRNFKTRLE